MNIKLMGLVFFLPFFLSVFNVKIVRYNLICSGGKVAYSFAWVGAIATVPLEVRDVIYKARHIHLYNKKKKEQGKKEESNEKKKEEGKKEEGNEKKKEQMKKEEGKEKKKERGKKEEDNEKKKEQGKKEEDNETKKEQGKKEEDNEKKKGQGKKEEDNEKKEEQMKKVEDKTISDDSKTNSDDDIDDDDNSTGNVGDQLIGYFTDTVRDMTISERAKQLRKNVRILKKETTRIEKDETIQKLIDEWVQTSYQWEPASFN